MPQNDTAVKGQQNIYTSKGENNALAFAIRQMMNGINTCLPCKVVAVYPSNSSTGYVDVLPLVTYVDGMGKAVQPVTHYHLPYSRIQGGIAALIIDPVVGDKGLAVFASRDVSTVTADTNEPQQPASFRRFSESDGYYIGGFLNQAPQVFVELTQDKKCNITATGGVHIVGDVTVEGTITASGDIVGNGHSLTNHYHHGVHGDTSPSVN